MLSVSTGASPPQIGFNYRYFLDRKAVIDHVGAIKVRSLKKAGYKVMQTARRSIERKGMARPMLAVMRENPGMKLSTLVKAPGMSAKTRNSAIKRLREIKSREASDPGKPPHTHTGMFRNHITFSWDPGTQSVVIGQTMPNGAWLARLHEFGGSQSMSGWAYVPRFKGGYKSPIMMFLRSGRSPRNTSRWSPTRMTENRRYPPRPYMQPAIMRNVSNGAIVNSFRVGGQ